MLASFEDQDAGIAWCNSPGKSSPTDTRTNDDYIWRPLIFKHGRSQSGASISHGGNSSVAGPKGSVDHTIVLNGKTLKAKYEIELDENNKSVNEVLEIGGKPVDIKSGRLFLIDLTTASPTYEQKDVELPKQISELESPADVESMANKTLEALKAVIPEDY